MFNLALSIGKKVLRALLGMEDKSLDIDLEKYKENADVHKDAMNASVEIEKLRAKQRISDNSFAATRWIRPAWAGAPIFYYWCIVMSSTFFKDWTVLQVPTEVNYIFGMIAAFFFGGRMVEKTLDKWGKK